MISPDQLTGTDQAHEYLGEGGIAAAAARLSTNHADCLSCQQPFGAAALAVNAVDFPHHGLVMAQLHHAACDPPGEQTDTTYLVTGYGLPDGTPLLMVNPSLEQLWLKPRRKRVTGRVRGWSDTTASAFGELGLVAGRNTLHGPVLPESEVSNASIAVDGSEVRIAMPPHDTWSAPVGAQLATMIRNAGGAYVVVTTATDHSGDQAAALKAVLASEDYMIGWVTLATTHDDAVLTKPVETAHPMLQSAAIPTMCRTTFLDDHALGRDVMIFNRSEIEQAGVDTDRFPVALFEHLYSQVNQETGQHPMVESLVHAGLPRLDWESTSPPPALPGWRLSSTSTGLTLTDPAGRVYAENRVTPQAEWLSAALGHRSVLVAVGPLLGVRDSPNAEHSYQELSAASALGLVLGGFVNFQRG